MASEKLYQMFASIFCWLRGLAECSTVVDVTTKPYIFQKASMEFFNTRGQAHLQQYRCKDLSYSLVEGVDGRLQHGWDKETLVKVVFCDHCGMQLEEHHHLLSAIPRCLNLTKEDEMLKKEKKILFHCQVNTWWLTDLLKSITESNVSFLWRLIKCLIMV